MIPTFSFTVSFLDPGLHIYHVKLHVTELPPGRHTIAFPVWTPGSYEVEDYARHLFDLAVESGAHPLSVHHASKNSWEFETFDAGDVDISYKIYAFELGVATSHLDQSHAYWNGAQLFGLVDQYKDVPYHLSINAPASWHASTGLEPDAHGHGQYLSASYDVLVDSPFEVGTHAESTFEVDGKLHTLAIWGHGNEDVAKLTEDVRKIVLAQHALFGSLPYSHYTFILHLSDKPTGGLEHLNSTTCGVERFSFRPWKKYRRVLGLIAHEFFHLWNVKRIHPEALGPFDYNQEVYTQMLWAMEGFTDYYAYVSLRRSALYSPTDYLEGLGKKMATYEKQPGRFVQSLAESSFDTWIKLYKPDEDSVNRTISYYLKGDLVGMCLDLEIRRRTENAASLDDVLRRLFERYGTRGVGFPESVYQETVEEVAQSSFADFFQRYIFGTDPLPMDAALATAGFEVIRQYKKQEEDKDTEAPEKDGATQTPMPWLGIDTKTVGGQELTVKSSYATGPAASLLNAGDQIVGLNGFQIKKNEELQNRILEDHQVGDTVTVNIFRRGFLESIPVVLGPQPFDKVVIKPVKEPSALQKAIAESWLGASWDQDLAEPERAQSPS